jgi:alkenylglycerophosphocholine/alkenylglycerophosphoethanolamine hydrolase
VLAAAVYVAALGLAGAEAVRLWSKPVPALVLAALVAASGGGRYRKAIACGLVLSAAGDVLLEFPDRFVPGLVAFLLAHVAYTTAFLTSERRRRLARAAPFAVWLLGAFLWLRPGLGPMAGPVVVYMLAIGAMMWRAAARVGGGEEAPGARAALVGAVLFGLSDTLIAIDRFHAPFPGARYAIILLYWAGQAGIAASARRRLDSPPLRPSSD